MGKFSQGYPTGQGLYKSKKGINFNGFFNDSKLEGYGQINWQEKKVFSGNFKEGVAHGEGTLVVKGQGFISGFWDDGNLKYLDFDSFFY